MDIGYLLVRFNLSASYRLLDTVRTEDELQSLRRRHGMRFDGGFYCAKAERRRLSCNKIGYKGCHYSWFAVADEQLSLLYVFQKGEHSHAVNGETL